MPAGRGRSTSSVGVLGLGGRLWEQSPGPTCLRNASFELHCRKGSSVQLARGTADRGSSTSNVGGLGLGDRSLVRFAVAQYPPQMHYNRSSLSNTLRQPPKISSPQGSYSHSRLKPSNRVKSKIQFSGPTDLHGGSPTP